MRLKIDTSDVKFRVAGIAKAKQVKGEPARTPDGRPVWTVRLTAIEADRNSAETIWVEVAGDEPKLNRLISASAIADYVALLEQEARVA